MDKYLFLSMGQSNAWLMYPALKEGLIDYYGSDRARVDVVAQGNTEISAFQKGTPLYQNCVGKVLQAKADGFIFAKLFIWIGETDARLGQSSTFKQKMVDFIYNLRLDTSTQPKIYFFIIGQCPHPEDAQLAENWRAFQQMQADITLSMPNYTAIFTHNFSNYPPDVPHRSTGDYEKLAKWTIGIATT